MNWINTFKNALLIIINTLVLVLLISLLSIFLENLYYSSMMPSYESSTSYRQENYSHMEKRDVDDLLRSTWTPGYEYEEVVGFREKQRTTKFVNVNELGFRSLKPAKDFYSSLDGAVWFFGGSTTFGYGVSDNETIPAYLEKLSKQPVVNLGRGYYYSEQENLLLLNLLKYGHRPSKVIFFDGLNERCDISIYQKEMELLFRDQQTQSYKSYLISLVKPSLRFIQKIVGKITETQLTERQRQASEENLNKLFCDGNGSQPIPLKSVLSSNLLNRKAICEEYNLDCATLVQPVAGTHGIHLGAPSNQDISKDVLNKFNHLEGTFDQYGAVSVTAALDNFPSHAFVDFFHHSAAANLEIAEYISEKLRLNQIDALNVSK